MENGAKEVHSYITHGVLSGPAVERVANSVMKSLVITDTIEATKAVKAAKNIRIVPTAPMFTQAIFEYVERYKRFISVQSQILGAGL